MRTQLRLVATALALVAASACASSSARYPQGSGTAGDGPVTVRVENQNVGDFELYLDRDGVRTRLGVVTGSGSDRFVLDRALFPGTGQLRLALVSLGRARSNFRTPPVLVEPGDTVVLTIGVDLALTRIDVRR